MKRHKNKCILVLTDTHIPYHDKRMFQFLKDVSKRFNPDRVVHVGDLVDNYNVSQYLKDPNHNHTVLEELTHARKAIKKLADIFPNMLLVKGNHDARYEIAAARVSIPSAAVVTLKNLFGMPKGWVLKDEHSLTVDNKWRTKLLFKHYSGANSLTEAERAGKCYIQGHAHKKANVQWTSNGKSLIFGMNVPPLISDTGCPYRYDKLANQRPTRGCAMIVDGVPQIIPLGKVGW